MNNDIASPADIFACNLNRRSVYCTAIQQIQTANSSAWTATSKHYARISPKRSPGYRILNRYALKVDTKIFVFILQS